MPHSINWWLRVFDKSRAKILDVLRGFALFGILELTPNQF
jgi:uncharacterized membrane protein YeiB